jgi:hypothetical protein
MAEMEVAWAQEALLMDPAALHEWQFGRIVYHSLASTDVAQFRLAYDVRKRSIQMRRIGSPKESPTRTCRCRTRNSDNSVLVYVRHLRRLRLPIFLIMLHDTQTVQPQIRDSKAPGHDDGFLECLGHCFPWDGDQVLGQCVWNPRGFQRLLAAPTVAQTGPVACFALRFYQSNFP